MLGAFLLSPDITLSADNTIVSRQYSAYIVQKAEVQFWFCPVPVRTAVAS
jgi:hypothetical protein